MNSRPSLPSINELQTTAGTRMRPWLGALLLSTPVMLFFIAHFVNHDSSIVPTGFTQYDNVSYAANARQLVTDGFHLTYANRLNDAPGYPAIYFQPQHLLLALMMKAGMPPGAAMCAFVCIFSLLFFRLLIALYQTMYPRQPHETLIMLLFAWGGGLLALSGSIMYLAHPGFASDLWSASTRLDPAAGWWGLNLGRSLFFSLESYYHFLFFAAIYAMIKQRWITSAILALLLSLSHPFTGAELLAIVTAWLALEKLLWKNPDVPWYFVLVIISIGCWHAWYYLIYLNHFPEHRAVFTQYRLNWRLRFYNMIPAYAIVATLAACSLWWADHKLTAVNRRLLICWTLIAFILANHELLFPPMQPLHFTRGYEWAPLFLVGVPALQAIFDKAGKGVAWRLGAALLVAVLLSDNLNWLMKNTRYAAHASADEVAYLEPARREVLLWLTANANERTLLIGSDITVPYLATVYTPAFAWMSHPYNTPFYAERQAAYTDYLQTGNMPRSWTGRQRVFLVRKSYEPEFNRYRIASREAKKLFENDEYLLYTR